MKPSAAQVICEISSPKGKAPWLILAADFSSFIPRLIQNTLCVSRLLFKTPFFFTFEERTKR